MPVPKRVLCLMDMAGVGRSSLAVVLPVLAACGVQACPLPTALYSTHTGGFGTVAQRDTSAWGSKALAHYAEQGLRFDAIYIGYLAGDSQFRLATRVLAAYPDAYKVVDPAIGDNGTTYAGISGGTIEKMRALCQGADLLTPNYTESALLVGAVPNDALRDVDALPLRMSQLAGETRSVLVTSVPGPDKSMAILGCVPGGDKHFVIPVHQVPQSYPGTGDLFTAAVLGLMLGGLSLEKAAMKAADFVGAAARATYEGNGEVRNGVWFEAFLGMLAGSKL